MMRSADSPWIPLPCKTSLIREMLPASVSVVGEFFLGCLADIIFCLLEDVLWENPPSDEPVEATNFELSIMGLLLMLRLPQSSIKPYWGCWKVQKYRHIVSPRCWKRIHCHWIRIWSKWNVFFKFMIEPRGKKANVGLIKYLCVLIHIWIKGEVGAVKLV